MSKKVLFLLIAVLTAGYAHAQVSIGARAGLNFTNLIGDRDMATFKPGFQVGAVLNGARNNVFSLEAGFLFSQMGAQAKEDGDTYSLTLNYFEIPYNAKFRFEDFFVQAGLYIAFGLRIIETEKEGGIKYSESGSFKEYGLKDMDYGIGAGFGYHFGPIQASLNAKISALSILNGGNARNFGVALTATYFFELF